MSRILLSLFSLSIMLSNQLVAKATQPQPALTEKVAQKKTKSGKKHGSAWARQPENVIIASMHELAEMGTQETQPSIATSHSPEPSINASDSSVYSFMPQQDDDDREPTAEEIASVFQALHNVFALQEALQQSE